MKNKILFTALLFLVFTSFSHAQAILQEAFPYLTFTRPNALQHAGDGTNRIFVVEQEGIIKVFPNSGSVTSASTFLDITSIVRDVGEKGLLGLAFHPNYETNGYFYVHYTRYSPLVSFISRFQVSSSDPNFADANSEQILLSVNQPDNNHNGGWVGFGPDGFLYIAFGEGGGSGDPAQDVTDLLGSMLRIDVDNQDTGLQYAIPPGNPFANSTGNERKEIYAWGFRNPWRGSFDPVTGRLWIGDVGQYAREEVDIIENGKNYGWGCYEGTRVETSNGCNYPEYIFPVWEYTHAGVPCAVMGGYVYRGTNIPGLVGKYLYGDYCEKTVRTLEYDGTSPTVNQTLLTAPGQIVSFGVDQSSELYVLTINSPNIYMFINDPLPVELVNFNGEYFSNNIRITWATATEIMNYGFELERTVNSNRWNKIAFISGHGNSNSPKNYNYTDNDLHSSGIYKYRLKQIDNDGSFEYSDEILVNVNKPNQFLLNQNYPNPFNPNTTISYSIPVKAFVSINIYDVLGTEVATLVNKEMQAGSYEVEFNGRELSSGIYYYKIQAGDLSTSSPQGQAGQSFVETKKMVLMK